MSLRLPRRVTRALAVVLLALVAWTGTGVTPASAQVPDAPEAPEAPQVGDEADADAPDDPEASINIDLEDADGRPSQSILIILLLTLLAVAPALLIMLTGFTRIVIVLSLARNALGLQTVPPNQVIVGLSLFLSLFVMAPTLSEVNEQAVQPLLAGEISQGEAYDEAVVPIREFMMAQTRTGELSMFITAAGQEQPETADDVSLTSLIPAFILSELKTAFIIGFIVFIPFLVIDIVVASSLMSMGMMMLPPVMISLPFKLLLFVMVDGWGLITRSLITSFN